MKPRKPAKKLTPLERMVEFHKTTCAVHTYSGDRHCSCGRDEAVKELEQLRRTAVMVQQSFMQVQL